MNQQTKPDQAKITALQQAYKSALLSVDRVRAEEVLRAALHIRDVREGLDRAGLEFEYGQ